jgi:hypothetical protein
MMKDDRLQIYSGTGTKVSTTGTETSGGSTTATPNLGGDARCLPAEALGELGRKADRPAVIRTLQDAARSSDERLREAARASLRKIRDK